MLFQPVDRHVEGEAALQVVVVLQASRLPPQKRASQGSSSRRTKCQKTKPNETSVEPLTYHEVEPNSDPEPPLGQASQQTRVKVYSQWYRRSDKVVKKAKIRAMRKTRKMRAIRKTVKYIVVDD